jgi:ADP-ribose pyrophosphatase YjhB (NUDIX family)
LSEADYIDPDDRVRRQGFIDTLLRHPLVRPDGLLDPEVYKLRAAIGAISCVDGVLIRRTAIGLEGGVIRRGTGRFAGKLALVGGVVALYENARDAIRRHYRDDLGFDVEPATEWCLSRDYAPQQEGENRPGFCHDPGKHSAAKTFIMKAQGDVDNPVFGKTLLGGQEATRFEWFHPTNTPEPEHWAYDMHPTFIEVMRMANAFVTAEIIAI